MRRRGEWAFLAGELTVEEPADPALDQRFFALARLRQGRWQIVELDAGSNDVPYLGWAERHDLPRGLLPGGDISDW